MARGRPLWFLGSVLAGWTGLRMTMLWPVDLPVPALAATPARAAVQAVNEEALSVSLPRFATASLTMQQGKTYPTVRAAAQVGSAVQRTPLIAAIVPLAADPPPRSVEVATRQPSTISPPLVPRRSRRSRLTGDVWLVARPNGGDDLAFGQLGASQGGARLTYAVDERRRVALSARVSAPLRGSGGELGLGVDIRPSALPLHLLVEERIGLSGGGARPAVTAVTGGSVPLPGGARLDGYAQGGAVWRRGGFVDAAALVAKPVLQRGTARVEIGAGAWGAAQRRVARLDLGPSIALVTSIGGKAARLQLDYRARVTGQARPSSGPALTLGGSF